MGNGARIIGTFDTVGQDPVLDGDAPGGGSLRHPASIRRCGRTVALALPPGTRLSRPDMAEAFGLSQPPVRDATLKLEQEGLVAIFAQSKTVVSRIYVEHARRTRFLRLGLELEIGRMLALSPDKSGLIAARRVLQMQRTALEDEDGLARFAALDHHFHYALGQGAGVTDLLRLVAARSRHIDRLRSLNLPDPGKAATVLRDHADILSAIESGDAAATEASLRRHLSGTLASVDDIKARHPDYF
ncbi:MAG: DNA-binding GntR family transcriptional regulator [Paracoccaceae bacterium]